MTTPNKDDMLNKVRALLAKAEGTDSEHEAEASGPGTALVLRSREVAVNDAMAQEYPRLRSVTARAGNVSGYGRGHADGMRANLHNRSGVGTTGQGADAVDCMHGDHALSE